MNAAKQFLLAALGSALLALSAGCTQDAPADPDSTTESATADGAQSPAAPDAAPDSPPVPPPASPLEAGRAFLAENGMRASVVTTGSGLQYEVLVSGDGATPGGRDMVTTHYHGTLVDGRVFDSSVQRGQPIAFPVDGVIKGWTEALQLMQVGDKWKLYIPPELAYGERGQPPAIGANETLIFEVELIDLQRRG